MATPAQVIAALTLNNNFTILNQTAPINTGHGVDGTGWTALGYTTGHGDTAKIITQVVDPSGQIPYQNTGWATGSFASPDTTLASLTGPQYNLNTYTGTTTPIYGTYVINWQVQVTPSGGQAFVVTKSFNVVLDGALVPVVSLQESYNCFTASYTSTDVTVYGGASGYSISSIARTHMVVPPIAAQQPGSAPLGQTPVTANAQTVVLSAPTNQLWTGTYSVSLVSVITYLNGTNTVVVTVDGTTEQQVVCDNALCKLMCCLNSLVAKYQAVKGINTTLYTQYYNQWQKGLNWFTMIAQELQCQNNALVGMYTINFYLDTGCDPNCDCGCDDASAPVQPTSNMVGPAGPAGPQGPTGNTGATGATGPAAVSIIYNEFPNAATTGTGSFEALTTATVPANTLPNNFDMMHIRSVYVCGQGGGNTDLTQLAGLSFGGVQLNPTAGFVNVDLQVLTYDLWLTRLTSTSAKYEVIVKAYTTSSGIDYPAAYLSFNSTEIHQINTIASGLDFTSNMNVIAQGAAGISPSKQVVNTYLRVEYEPA